MAKSYFRVKELQPAEENLREIMQESKVLWDTYVDFVDKLVPGTSNLWKYYGKAWGWCMVYIEKKKNLMYLTPGENCFYVSFTFSDKNRETAADAGLTDEVIQIIESGKSNTAGHTFDIEVRNDDDLELVKSLLKIKCGKFTK